MAAETIATIGPSTPGRSAANAMKEPANHPAKNQAVAAAIRFMAEMWNVGARFSMARSGRTPSRWSRDDAAAHRPKGGVQGGSGSIHRTFVPPAGGSMRLTRRRRSRGQSLAEFAIVFPVLMVIVGGIIQFGIIFWGQNTLTQVARDTGRWAATQTTACSTAATDVLGTAKSIASQSSLIGNSSAWDASNVEAIWTGTGPCPPVNNQTAYFVTITLHHQVPVFFPFIPGNGNLTTSAQFRMEPAP
jgi:Flp pilus assembly protein TadG